ncbi:phosphoribosyl-ATP pyrophosphohydrolase [Clostridium sp.]|jgi:predicted house-cleaning noncanonical NTP pyrophosphatase (MazG superfamily)|uniref:phosphoribosyl-ATP pyrophosphohydrolase n=1 Tax=Clostridium sp. TaxID=1506 RepID=UPI003EEB7631
MKEYNKLVRDLIPEVVEKSGKKFDTHIAKTDEYKKLLEAKLLEEVNEYMEDNNLEELADVLEVLVGLAGYLGYTEEELFDRRKEKKEQRGGFDGGLCLRGFGNRVNTLLLKDVCGCY